MPPSPIFPPRAPTTYATVSLRHTVNLADFTNSTTILLASVPVDAFITSVGCEIVTAFNAATTNVLTLGTSQASANELQPTAQITAGTPAYYPATAGASSGRQNTQTAQALINNVDVCQGGVGIWAKYTQSGTAASTGKAIFHISYLAADNT